MTGKVSKFQAMLSSREVEEEPIDFPEEVPSITPVQPTAAKMGRPKGKRSNPDYTQVTSYIRQDTYRKVRMILLQNGDGQEFSELVEDLLCEFLDTQVSESSDF
jgi:hypothetical protein